MNVAYLLPDPGIPVGGTKGASVHVAEVTRALVRSGARVLLVAMRQAGAAPEGVEVVALDPGPLARGTAGEPARVATTHEFLARAMQPIRSFGPDLVYERLSLFAGDGAAVARHAGATRLVEVNAPITAERAGQQAVSDEALGERLERAALTGAHAIAVSAPLAGWAVRRGAARVTVVPNGVDTARFAPDPAARRRVRRALGLEGAEVVGFAGSLKFWHGVDVLLDAASRLAAGRPRLRVLVVGDGPERARLQSALPPALTARVQFVGAVPSAEMPAYLAAFDVAAAPYVAPGFGPAFYFSPLKVVEAMAAARPVVASRFSTIEELLGGTGRLVPPGDPVALAGAIDELLGDPGVELMGEAARRRAVSRHDWMQVAAEILRAAQTARAGLAEGAAQTARDADLAEGTPRPVAPISLAAVGGAADARGRTA